MSKETLIYNCLGIAANVVAEFEAATVTYRRGKGYLVDLHDGKSAKMEFKSARAALAFVATSIQHGYPVVML